MYTRKKQQRWILQACPDPPSTLPQRFHLLSGVPSVDGDPTACLTYSPPTQGDMPVPCRQFIVNVSPVHLQPQLDPARVARQFRAAYLAAFSPEAPTKKLFPNGMVGPP